LKKQGRNVSISTADIKKVSKVELIKEFKQMLKYEYVEYDVFGN
jgi:hypothetical protein